ncbi:hypothetical protein SK128_013301, partial [Halocaridina rubra]
LTEKVSRSRFQSACNFNRETEEVRNLRKTYQEFFQHVKEAETLLDTTCPDPYDTNSWIKIHEATTILDNLLKQLQKDLPVAIRGLKYTCPTIETRLLQIDVIHGYQRDLGDGLFVEIKTETLSGSQCTQVNRFAQLIPTVKARADNSSESCYCLPETTTSLPSQTDVTKISQGTSDETYEVTTDEAATISESNYGSSETPSSNITYYPPTTSSDINQDTSEYIPSRENTGSGEISTQ